MAISCSVALLTLPPSNGTCSKQLSVSKGNIRNFEMKFKSNFKENMNVKTMY